MEKYKQINRKRKEKTYVRCVRVTVCVCVGAREGYRQRWLAITTTIITKTTRQHKQDLENFKSSEKNTNQKGKNSSEIYNN